MRSKVVGLVVAAALLASVGIANAEGPVTLTDGQLDNITAGAMQTSASVAANAAAATATLDYVGAVKTAVSANIAVTAAFNNMVAADTGAFIVAATP